MHGGPLGKPLGTGQPLLPSLAPAAGAGIGKLLAEKLLADPEFVPLMLAAAKNGLKASRSFWAKTGANGGGEIISEPDARTQVQTFALLLAHMEGEPIKRVIHQYLGGGGDAIDPLAALQASPELLAAAQTMIEKARWRHEGQAAHKRPTKRVFEATATVPPATEPK